MCVIIFQYLRFTLSGHLNACVRARLGIVGYSDARNHFDRLSRWLVFNSTFGVCLSILLSLLLPSWVDLSWFQCSCYQHTLVLIFLSVNVDGDNPQMHGLWWWRCSVVELRSADDFRNFITSYKYTVPGKYVDDAHFCCILKFSRYTKTNWIQLCMSIGYIGCIYTINGRSSSIYDCEFVDCMMR